MALVVLALQVWSMFNSRSTRWEQMFYPSMFVMGVLFVVVSVADMRAVRKRHEV